MSMSNFSLVRDINQCRQLVDQLMQECRRSDAMFRQMLLQEAENARVLEEESRRVGQFMDQLAQRERLAVNNLEMALRENETAFQRLQQASRICSELESAAVQMNVSQAGMASFGQNVSQQIQ